MLMDRLLLFSSAQVLTTGTIASTDVIDLTNARDLGPGRANTMLSVTVTAAFVTTDSATLTVQFQVSTDNSTFTTLVQSRAYAASELTLGAKLLPIDWATLDDAVALPRYVRLAYVMGALHFSPGSVTAGMVIDRQDDVKYPAGINIAN